MVPPVAEKEALVGSDLVVHAGGQAGPFTAVDLRVFKILKTARGRRPVRQRIILERVHRDRVEALRGNRVAREGRAHKPAACRRGRGRIVNDERPPGAVEGLREIALPLERRGEDGPREGGASNLCALEIEKVESLVPAVVQLRELEGSAECRPVGVLFEFAFRTPHAVVEEVVGVEIIVAQVPVKRAVILVGSGPSGHVDKSGAGVAELGIVGAGLHAHLLHGVR